MSAAELTWFGCCLHCGCKPDDRGGHDDTCSYGCNDPCPTCLHPLDSAEHHADCKGGGE